jgi:hypothetical protein
LGFRWLGLDVAIVLSHLKQVGDFILRIGNVSVSQMLKIRYNDIKENLLDKLRTELDGESSNMRRRLDL